MNSIEISHLTKKFGNFVSVDNISFNVKKGEIFGFLGANGAGKSTTIRMLCGILTPTSGDATVNGFSITKETEKVKKSIGYMSQKFSLYDDLTVGENIDFFGGVYGLYGAQLKARKEWTLEISDLKGKEHLLTGSLPGGIKQRLALGTAVIHKPAIVFLDEPTSGVDPISRRNFWDLINTLSSDGTTLLVTTHYLEEAEFCHNIMLINAGKIIAGGTSKELKSKFIKGKILEIESNDPVTLMEDFTDLPFINDISIFGKKLHLFVNELYPGDEQLRKIAYTKYESEIISVNQITPTLEDVFIHLLEGSHVK